MTAVNRDSHIVTRTPSKALLVERKPIKSSEAALDAIFAAPEDPKALCDRRFILKSGVHQWGMMLFPNGDLYKGEFENEQPSGRGKIVYTDGKKYVGFVVKGLPDGKGTLFRKDGSKDYEGDWVNGHKEGQGTSFYQRGSKKYVGAWINDRENGKGTRFWHSKSTKETFTGYFKNGIRHGRGEEKFEGKTIRKGKWIKDKFQGSNE